MSDTRDHAFPDAAPESVLCCEVAPSDLEAFVACLALGTLEAMRSGSWSSEAGTWTLARPVFWRHLDSIGLPRPLLDVLQRADELSALEALAGRSAAEAELDKMIETVRASLARTASTLWRARWAEPGAVRAKGVEP